MLFEPEHYGHRLSQELSDHITSHTGKNDRFEVVGKLENISESTLRQVVYRQISLTEKNALAVIELMKLAHQNIVKGEVKFRQDKTYFEEKLQLVEH